ncbi:MAG: gamma carbonic anhydrase family protein [Firmicutes bacterium]|jgi:carbonic anhydrase/acetyltransferase-like protein (isoleucine patch superfamily)|nr:gamma carbonic anhydrase family protein [Bacillota bacterium]
MIVSLGEKVPQIRSPSFVAPTATVVGDVIVGERCSIWYGAVVRADINRVEIGEGTSIQENAVVHVSEDVPTSIGRDVTVGHGAMLHGCTIGDRTLVGIGATVLDKAEIGEECIVAAGAVVPPGAKIPPRSMVVGVPAKVSRTLSEGEALSLKRHADRYWELAVRYRD